MPTTDNRRKQQLMNADEQLWREVKAAAALKGQTMTAWTEEIVRKALAQTPKKKSS